MNTATATVSAASTTSIVVSNAVELKAALAAAKGGETIVLKAGDYGDVSLTGGKDIPAAFASEVTIRSEDPGNPASFGRMTLQNASNLKFDGVVFDYEADFGAAIFISPFLLRDITNVSIVNSKFDGDLATGLGSGQDGFGTGYGLAVVNGTSVTLKGNEFFDFARGAVITQSNGVSFVNNSLHDLSSDGLDFADVDNVLIKGNSIRDFHYSPTTTAHPDMIQFWTTGTTSPSVNIKIINNLLDIGDGQLTQSIFMRNELVDGGKAGSEMFYRNVEISGNIIRNAHAHGITVGETSGLIISNNTVLQALTEAEGGSLSIPSINVATSSLSVVVTNNVAPFLGSSLSGTRAGWTVANNLIVQVDNPKAANYAGHLFADPFEDSGATVFDFRPVEGGLADQMGVGSAWPEALAANKLSGYMLTHETSSGGYIIQNFDASNIFLKQSKIDMSGASVSWNFGDGTTGSGLTVGHVYTAPGEYTATARITLASGAVVNLDKTFSVHSPNFVELDFDTAFTDQSSFANAATAKSATLVASSGGGKALQLNGGTVAYSSNSDFVYNDEFTILADFKKDVGEELQGGRLIYKSGSYIITIGANGVSATIFTSKKLFTLSAEGVGINDSDWHRIAVTFSGETGRAKLFVDGVVVDQEVGLLGAVQVGSVRNALYIGGPFGDSFGGLVDNVLFAGEQLLPRNIAAADPMASWAKNGPLYSPVVAGHLAGNHAVDLRATMTAAEIADLFSNDYSGIMTSTDFHII